MTYPCYVKNSPIIHNPREVPRSYMFYHKKSLMPLTEDFGHKIDSMFLPSTAFAQALLG